MFLKQYRIAFGFIEAKLPTYAKFFAAIFGKDENDQGAGSTLEQRQQLFFGQFDTDNRRRGRMFVVSRLHSLCLYISELNNHFGGKPLLAV